MKLPKWLSRLDEEHAASMCHAGSMLASVCGDLKEDLEHWRTEYRKHATIPAERAIVDEHIADVQDIIDRIDAVFAPWGPDPQAARDNTPLRSRPKRATKH